MQELTETQEIINEIMDAFATAPEHLSIKHGTWHYDPETFELTKTPRWNWWIDLNDLLSDRPASPERFMREGLGVSLSNDFSEWARAYDLIHNTNEGMELYRKTVDPNTSKDWAAFYKLVKITKDKFNE